MGVLDQVSVMGHEQVVFCNDPSTGLKAIIGIHDTTLGPALGGCRMWPYANEDEAVFDVLRLSKGMTYKNAVAGLNLGGGKAVIIGDPKKLKSESFFRSFGRFVNSLNGRYITAEDVNINVNDMEYVRLETDYVSGVSNGSGDPSPFTAFGVYQGIRAAVQHKLKTDSLKGIRVNVQGCGAVGMHLIELLHKDGAKICVSDISPEKTQKAKDLYSAKVVQNQEIFKEDAEVFAPCALGAILNDETIPMLNVKIVAGGANNQLREEKKHGQELKDRGILYAPDYVINAGGVINVAEELTGYNESTSRKKVSKIYDTLIEIFKDSEHRGILTLQASNELAERRIAAMRGTPAVANTLWSQKWWNHPNKR